MGRYKYVGRDRKGKRKGTINADSKRNAMEQLREDGVRVLEMDELPETALTKDINLGGNSVKLQHLTIYLRQFATLIKAGVTIVDSTKILAEQTESKPLRKALTNIESELRMGRPFSESAEKQKRVFSPMFINLIRAGEAGGNMEETLENLAVFFEKQHATRQKVKSAMSYPTVVGVIAIGVVIFLLTSVVPTFVGMFADMGAELPAITQFVLSASDFMVKYWWLVVAVIFAIVFGIIGLTRNSKTKYYVDYAILRMPIFGKMQQKAALARLTRTLSSLFTSGVPILQALSVVEKVVDNEVIAKVVREARDELSKGKSMTGPMQGHWAFPTLVVQMISIGEATGALDTMLTKVAQFYEQEVDNATEQLKALIEPLMIVFLAGLVGVIVMAIMVPMFDMFQHVDQM